MGTLSFPGIPAADVCDRLIGSPRVREVCTLWESLETALSAQIPEFESVRLL